jgi:glycine/D-amino acid oxidase-like deaminating enzyme
MMHEALPDNLVSQLWNRPLAPPEAIPEAADVVIIGGGIVGISTAWFLARRGVSVVVCEKGHVAGEQSSRNWGWVRQQARDIRELPMMIESMRIWRGLAVETGEDVGYAQTGCLFAASDDQQMQSFHDWIEIAKEHDLDTRVLSADEMRAEVRGAAGKWPGGMFTASDGRAEPHKATPAIARAAIRAGASILTSCAVRGIETEGGRVASVVTEHGHIRTSTVLCAAGAWSSMFCRSLGIRLPQLRVRGTVVRTAPAPVVLNGNLFDERIGIRRREDGGYTVAHGAILDHAITPSTFRFCFKFLPALRQEFDVLRLRLGAEFLEELRTPVRWKLDEPTPFEKTRVLNPEPNEEVIDGIRENLGIVFPELQGIRIVESWAGMVETTPDVVPIIDSAEDLPGFHIATGFSGHGFGLGPGAGKAIAAMLQGNDPGVDLQPLRLGRFFDGSSIDIQKSI